MSFINQNSEGKYIQYNHTEKNEIVLKANAVRTCSELCFKNLKTDFVINDENICLTRCFRKYLDTTQMGEQLANGISNNKLKLDNLRKGNFVEFSNEAKEQLNL